MTDHKGDSTKKPPECTSDTRCPYIKETSSNSDFNGESYECRICGEYFRLYYEDMT